MIRSLTQSIFIISPFERELVFLGIPCGHLGVFPIQTSNLVYSHIYDRVNCAPPPRLSSSLGGTFWEIPNRLVLGLPSYDQIHAIRDSPSLVRYYKLITVSTEEFITDLQGFVDSAKMKERKKTYAYLNLSVKNLSR